MVYRQPLSSRQALSSRVIPGEGMQLSIAFFRLSREHRCPISRRTAARSSSSRNASQAALETITFGVRMPLFLSIPAGIALSQRG